MRVYVLVFFVVVVAARCCASDDAMRFDSLKRGQREFNISAGYGENHRIPKAVKNRFGFDTIDVRWGTMTSPRTQIALEVSVGRAFHGTDSLSLSTVFSYRRNFIVRGSTAVGYNLNIGLIYMDNKPAELGTAINFTEQAGIVLQVGTGRNSAVVLEYKFCHVSNAGIELPNVGLNWSVLTIGYSVYR